ncbi:hypothetical protein shn_19915 [Shinella sp. HZN7]|nr:hypothetical protein shn_19915 [Shinella sp. HZN7]
MDIRQSPAFSRKLRKFEHHGIRLDNTGMFYQIESPPSMRFLDLPLIIPAFMEEKLEIRIALGPGQAEIQQKIQIRQGPSRNRITMRDRGRRLLDANRVHRGTRTRFQDGCPQKGGFLVVAFDEMNPSISCTSQKNTGNNARKPTTTAEIGPDPRPRAQCVNLHTIDDMAVPDFRQCRGRHQIDGLRPFLEESDKSVQPILSFT